MKVLLIAEALIMHIRALYPADNLVS